MLKDGRNKYRFFSYKNSFDTLAGLVRFFFIRNLINARIGVVATSNTVEIYNDTPTYIQESNLTGAWFVAKLVPIQPGHILIIICEHIQVCTHITLSFCTYFSNSCESILICIIVILILFK